MIDDDAIEIVQTDIQKRSRNGAKSPISVNDNTKIEPSAMKRLIECALYWNQYPQANTDDEIEERSEVFFNHMAEIGEYPLWEAYCLSLGHDRKCVWRWANGIGCSDRKCHAIKKAKDILAYIDAHLAVTGVMPQIVYIFRSKNFHDMVDKQEYTIEPKNTLGNVTDPNDIEKRLTDGV
jgi:hypothetical protein